MKPAIGIFLIILIFIGLFYFYSVFAAQQTNDLLLRQQNQNALSFEQKRNLSSFQEEASLISSLDRINNL